MAQYESLKAKFEAAGQGHLFNFWPQLKAPEREALLAQLSALDIERVNRVFAKAIQAESSPSAEAEKIEPPPADAVESVLGSPEKVAEWRAAGLDAIARGTVGVILMAGGQGTRLGSTDPKGCYDIGLPSHKSLFQYQAERIAGVQAVAEKEIGKPTGSVIIPWYVMTSGPTRKATEKYFRDHKFFGLKEQNVIFFEQGTLPCLTMDGKVFLETPSQVAVAPDGNGGLYAALRQPLKPTDPSRTVLSDLESRKITHVHAYCVDNCLVRVADPVFLGYSIQKQADCAAKVARKTVPTESVGVIALRGGKFGVVEYSEISQEQTERRDPKNPEELAFRAANIANHVFSTAFLARVESFESEMAFHIARKKIPHVDLQTGQVVKPSTPNGMKLELFVFDVFPHAQQLVILEVDRREEFSPLKNAPGSKSDNPETSRADLLSQQRRFLEAAGATVKDGVEIELSPLATYAGEGLGAVKGKTFSRSGLIENVQELDALV
ncbi:hypothetical protein BOTBODRAFT_54497 [Botryobasidium botryosum FD-172 SS1]|uniref:UDP-N-acetylglucosamine diphosphorylase n=1 Tax=Botryobasidium botryosum (strain FD-172 SS1) TaxID=930990 RepID=A0A067MJ68_BOTB1|nr:hypothetical protein BOTBODRAFT_54497 [Botryobasidium botryosum FD-172 SS1]